VKHKEILHGYVAAHYLLSVLSFILLYVIIAGLSIPASAILSMAGGFLFGVVLGIVYVNIGATLGSACIFLVTRYLLGGWLQNRYRPQLQRFNKEMARHGYNYLLTLRLIPIFPFFLVNIFGGLTKLSFWSFIWTTSLGILPADAVYTFAGSQLGSIGSVEDVFSRNMIIVLSLLALLSLAPVIYTHMRRSR